MSDNNIVYEARLHRILFSGPILLCCFGLFLAMEVEALSLIGYFFSGLSLLWGVMVWMTYQFSSVIIKQKQIIVRTGVLVRNTLDIPMTKIETIDIRQSLLGSVLNYGTLVITGTGGTRQFINCLNKPLTCRRYIEQLMHA